MFKGLQPILYGGREVWPLVEGGKGVSATNHASSGAWAAAGGIGTVSAVNADSYDPEGRIIPQVYAEVHLPILTPRGLDLRAGRFLSPMGFESPQAIARPLLSVPYLLNFTPFTFFGAYANLHVHERLNVWSGTIDGFDRWPNEPYKWGYLGGLSWTSRDQKLNLVVVN